MIHKLRRCRTCSRTLPITEFHRDGSHIRRTCKHCRSVERRGDRYGIDAAELQLLKEVQGNSCGICGSKEKLVVDHCHSTNNVRGLLCSPCNQGIGHFRDNPEALMRAAQWVDPFQPNAAEVALRDSDSRQA